MEVSAGFFTISPVTVLVAKNNLNDKAEQLKKYLDPATGFILGVTSKAFKKNCIELRLDNSLNNLGEEGYLLKVNPDKIILSAFNEKGIGWGIQTLRQLLPVQILRQATVKDVPWKIPCLEIKDSPHFKWRGLMLDCSRTFIPKRQIEKYLEIMSFFKMNVLQMHLTDNQGWRLEIKKYPKLTSISSKFDSSFHEPEEYQGYYSQDNIRELVEFARERNIQIVPEIEMPGHSSEVFAAYPELSCKGDTTKVEPWKKGAGLNKNIFCAGNDETFTFLENVLDEMADLFPSQYIHIGGDEAPKRLLENMS